MSFLNKLNIFLERNDYGFGNKISILFEKLKSYLKQNSSKLIDIADIFNDGMFWYSFEHIDSRHKKLFFVLKPVGESKHSYINNARFITYSNDTIGKFYAIELNVLTGPKGSPDQFQNPDFIKELFDKNSLKRSIYHELTHYFDQLRDTRTKEQVNKNRMDITSIEDLNDFNKYLEKYYNLPDELNAYWNEVSIALINYLKKNKSKNIAIVDFHTFKNIFMELFNKHGMIFDKLSEENKKRILKRIYTFHEELKNKLDD